jgi:hypothetical protein
LRQTPDLVKLFHLFPHGNGPVLPAHNEGSFFVVKRRRHEPTRQALFIVAQSTGKPTRLFSAHAA